MSIVRIVSAIVLFRIGLFLDQNNSKYGKYKPWVVISWPLIGISGYFIFKPLNSDAITKLIYVTVSFILFIITSSINSVSSSGFGLTLTKRNEDRMQISLFSYVSILIFSIVSYVLFFPLVNILGHNNFENGVARLMFIIMSITILQAILVSIMLNERFVTPVEGISEKYSFLQVIIILIKNKYVLISIIYNFSVHLFNLIRMSVTVYYFKYYFRDINMIIISGAISLIPSIVAAFISQSITKKIGIKKVIVSGITVNIITSILVYFIPSNNIGKIIFYILFTIGSFFLGLCQPAQGIMMPVAADYSEWRYKINIGGLLGSLNNFVQIIASAI